MLFQIRYWLPALIPGIVLLLSLIHIFIIIMERESKITKLTLTAKLLTIFENAKLLDQLPSVLIPVSYTHLDVYKRQVPA